MTKEEILNKLKKAANAYYNGDDSELTDEEYDNLNQFAESQGWLKEDETLNDGAIVNLDNVIHHNVPMQLKNFLMIVLKKVQSTLLLNLN